MKKNLITFILLCMSSLSYCIIKDNMIKILSSSHAGAFGKDNLYEDQLDPTDVNRWYNTINELKKFVDERSSSSYFGGKDKDLVNALSTIEKANMDLVNAIKIIRGAANSPNVIKQNIAILENIKNIMLQVQRNLQNAMFFVNKTEKSEARDVLINAAMFIEITASKAIKDTTKL